jgi:hypothetical protein
MHNINLGTIITILKLNIENSTAIFEYFVEQQDPFDFNKGKFKFD